MSRSNNANNARGALEASTTAAGRAIPAAGSSSRRPLPAGAIRLRAVPFTLRNLKEDLQDLGSNFDGAPDLEFRMATQALALEQSGLSYQSVPPTNR